MSEDVLTPSGRLLLSEALRPPHGHQLDVAVGTTYSLDLNSLLLVPFLFSSASAQGSDTEGRDGAEDPTSKLAALRRHAGRITVFAQGGNIHAPSRYQAFHTFLEDSVVQVTSVNEGRIFHPKIWVLRFTAPGVEPTHRLVCASRNITPDTAWDTVLTCDQAMAPDSASTAPPVIEAGPLVDFLRALTELPGAELGLTAEHRAQVTSLISSVSGIPGFEVPAPFEGGRLLPLGLPGVDLVSQWPVPTGSREWAVMSPFLDPGMLSHLPRGGRPHLLVSRPETLDRVATAISERWDSPSTRIISDWAQDTQDTQDTDSDQDGGGPAAESRDGLHAKLVLWRQARLGHLLLGSANCTSAAFGGNTEFCVELWTRMRNGQRWVAGVLGEDSEFADVLEDHAPTAPDPLAAEATDAEHALRRQIENALAALVLAGPRLRAGVAPEAPDAPHAAAAPGSTDTEDRFTLTLESLQPTGTVGPLFDPVRDEGWSAHVRPLSCPAPDMRSLPRSPDAVAPTWTVTGYGRVSPWLVLQVDARTPNAAATPVSVTRVIKAELLLEPGLPTDREDHVLRSLLSDPERIMRYLALLVSGDDNLSDLVGVLARNQSDLTAAGAFGLDAAGAPPLLESLLHLAAADPRQLARVGRDIDALTGAAPATEQLRELRDLWSAFVPCVEEVRDGWA